MDYIKIKVDEAKYLEIKDFYQAKELHDPKRPYDLFDIKTINGIQVKAYSSKGLFTILFAGDSKKITLESAIFVKDAKISEKKKTQVKANEEWEDETNQIGSDEVGVGDFFLGFFVCATFLDENDVKFIDSLGVKDSKKLTDSKILEIGPVLRNKIRNHIIMISPEKLSSLEDKGWSTHKILANAHYLAHKNLIEKYHISNNITIYIDQFEKEKTYRKYLLNNVLNNLLVFQTKGESYYPSVACASVLARYTFLIEWQKMEKHFGTTIPKGASSEVDKKYIELNKKYGQDELDPYVKKFFRNYKTI